MDTSKTDEISLNDYEWAVLETWHGSVHVHTYDRREQAEKAFLYYENLGRNAMVLNYGRRYVSTEVK